jgi:hypothetical protein
MEGKTLHQILTKDLGFVVQEIIPRESSGDKVQRYLLNQPRSNFVLVPAIEVPEVLGEIQGRNPANNENVRYYYVIYRL